MKKIVTTFFVVIVGFTIVFGQTQKVKTTNRETLNHEVQKIDTGEYNKSLLIGGNWFFPHDAMVNIEFYENFTFKFHNLKGVLLTGTFKIVGHDVWLTFKDGSKKKFFIDKKGSHECYIKSYPLEKKEYYLVHSEE